MPEYAQIQTYIICTRQTLPSVTAQYVNLLKSLRCTDTQLMEALISVTWPSKENEYLYFTSFSPFFITVDTVGEFACAGVGMMQDATDLLTDQEEAWITFNLYFEAEPLREGATSRYLPEQGKALWDSIRRFASFGEIGAYLTDEAQQSVTYESLKEGKGNLWEFDLAVIPQALAQHFHTLPPLFERVVVQEGIAFARRDRWMTFPWEETKG
jgi:hypothetical protein